MAISRWDPFQDVLPLRDAMNRLFQDSIVQFNGAAGFSSAVPVEVYTEGDNCVVEVALPGVDPDAVTVSVLGNQVAISGEYPAAPEGRQYLLHELPAGRFQRTLTLPSEYEVDKAQAQYEHGLLRLTLPKAEAAKPRRIALAADTYVALPVDGRPLGRVAFPPAPHQDSRRAVVQHHRVEPARAGWANDGPPALLVWETRKRMPG